MTLSDSELRDFVNDHWDNTIIHELSEYIKIPAKSPSFDENWEENGYLDQAVRLMCIWCLKQDLKGFNLSVEQSEERTPLLFIEIKSQGIATEQTVLLYGHLDKQPESEGWDADKGPWTPVLSNDRLYGRGGADDGYSLFSAISAIKALQHQGVPHPRCVIMIEASEEGGSSDLPHYFESLKDRIGKPGVVICLDADCGNYNQLWVTTSLRGTSVGELSVQLLTEGIHSGSGSGVIASSFRVMRRLLDRIEDAETGSIKLAELYADIPEVRREQAKQAAVILGPHLIDSYPLVPGGEPVSDDPVELILNRTWRPTLSTIGAAGFPSLSDAGNVLRPVSVLKLSLRLPPTVDQLAVDRCIKETLEEDPPYRAKVSYKILPGAQGWHASTFKDWFQQAIESASQTFFGRPVAYIGEGGSIPFMNYLNDKFPDAQFLVIGLLGPNSNAHGPNEFLHIPMAKRLTCCVAHVIAAHADTI